MKYVVFADRLCEAMQLRDLDADRAYDLFARSYQQATGGAWSKEKFLSRARGWDFYGNDLGFVAVRPQRSGMLKLVGVAGDPRAILKGLDELMATGAPIWGAVSAPLAVMAKKKGFIVPSSYPGGSKLIRALFSLIPASVFGGSKPTINPDGGVTFAYEDVGTATKYLIGNRQYFMHALRMPEAREKLNTVPGAALVLRLMGLSGGLSEARPAKPKAPRLHPEVWQTPAFKAWFGQSKVVDPDGSPQICIHAASQSIPAIFDPNKQRYGMGGYGFYFTNAEGANRYSLLHHRMFQIATELNQIPVFLKIENPLIVGSIEALKAWIRPVDTLKPRPTFGAMRGYAGNETADVLTRIQTAGYDGVITTETIAPRISKHGMRHASPSDWKAWKHPVYIVYSSNQIKSIWNRGTFDAGGNISEHGEI